MLVGIVADPQFGPVVACGAGGTTVELVSDVQVGIAHHPAIVEMDCTLSW